MGHLLSTYRHSQTVLLLSAKLHLYHIIGGENFAYKGSVLPQQALILVSKLINLSLDNPDRFSQECRYFFVNDVFHSSQTN